MPTQDALYQWTQQVTTHLPHLSKPQATVLALWSLGMVLARSCAITSVVVVLAPLLQENPANLRQRLREWCWAAADKAGKKRTQLEVETCFVRLLGWVLSRWQGKQLALALDATTLGDRFVVLAVSVLYRGCAIPIAWKVLAANEKHAWRPEWLRLLRLVHRAVPCEYRVIVLADRGLYARWLYARIVRLGWHPLLRINNGGTFRPAGCQQFGPLLGLVPKPGASWCGRGTAFSTTERRLECTLLACWREGCKDPWLLVSDLAPEAAEVCWYGLRAWIEQGFKVLKRAGWQWQNTRMSDPERASRLWLCLSVATLWLLAVGGEAEEEVPETTLQILPSQFLSARRSRVATRLRLTRVFRAGWVRLLVALIGHEPLPMGWFRPEPWPHMVPENTIQLCAA